MCSALFAVHYSLTSSFPALYIQSVACWGDTRGWPYLEINSHELTRRMEKFKILHTKYDKTGCLLRILITLNRPESELLTASLNKLQTHKWALGGMQQYGFNDVFYRQYFWWSSTLAQRRGQVYTCLRSTSALWTLVFSSCVVFSYNFMSWPTTSRVTSCFKDWFNLVKSSVALLPPCLLAKSSLADFQVGGNCIYQGQRREWSDRATFS